MSPAVKPKDPNKWMGVYKALEDVPEGRRLYQFQDSYEGRDVWAEFLQEEVYEGGASQVTKRKCRYVEESWKPYMEKRGRHHALATPEDVEEWTAGLLSEYAIATVYRRWGKIEEFYRWLQWHTKHPHLYDPVLMAVAMEGPSAEVWEERMSQRKGQ